MNRRFWAGLLFFVMLWSLLPASALAANEEKPAAEAAMTLTKNVSEPSADGMYTITMEAQATGKESTVTTQEPMDIVLVLDVSGSMAYNFDGNDKGSPSERCQYAMKQAVNSFIEKATSADGTHNMAIVTFGTDAKVLNSGWTKVDTEGAKALTNAINGLSDKPTGATNVGAGMQKAQELMNSAKSDTNRQKVVIVFTDGVPTTTNEFDTDVANSAITAAKSMKDAGVTVYTVGIFNGANPAQLHGDKFDRAGVKDNPCNGNVGEYWGYTNMKAWVAGGSESIRGLDIAATNRFLNFLSSNFTGATEIGIKEASHGLVGGQAWEITKNFNRTASNYYLTAKDSDSLNNMFQQIIQEISKLEIKADAKAILSDTLSEYFTFDGVTAEGTSKITVKTAEVSSVDKSGAYTWKEAKDYDDAVVTVTGKKLEVIGFDYTANAVTKNTNGDKVSYRGSKLIVTIPIKPDTTCTTWRAGKNAYATNDTVTNKAGLSGYTDKEEKTSLETVLSDSPEAMATAYTVTYIVTGEAPKDKDYEDSGAYITGQSASVLAAPVSPVEKDGFTYTFTGWQNDTELAGETIEIVDRDVVLTGTWSKVANEYTVTYVPYDVKDSNHPDGTIQVPDSVKHKKDTEVTVAGPLVSVRGTKDGNGGTWDFVEWKTSDVTIKDGKFTMPAEDVTLTGTWKFTEDKQIVIAHTLTYKLNGGKVAEDAEYTKAGTYAAGAEIAAPNATNMSKEGYTFAGWYTADNVKFTKGSMPDSDLTLYARWNEIPVAQTGKVIITKQVVDTDGNDLIPTGEFTFNVKKDDEIVGHDSLRYGGTKLTTATINLEEGSYNLSEDLDKAMNAIPGYELVGVRFVETFAESEPDTQAATDDTATTAFGDYRFEIKTSDSAIFVTCINTYEKKEVEPDTYTVTYTDGANGTAFANQVYTVHAGDKTPAFNGTPTRSGYTFNGWNPDVAETVTDNAIYTATWTKNSSGHDSSSDTYCLAIKKIDAQDGHVLMGAKFGLYADDKQIATAISSSKGYARFSLDERVYKKLVKNDDLYVMELTAPDGYVKSSRKYDVSVNDFVKNNVIGAQKQAITVTNSRSSTPDRLNDEEHFAYVIGYKDGNVRPYGLISRAETTIIFFRLLKDSVRDGNLLTSNTYTDVADNYWANTAISTMTGLGIVQGRTATTFDPYAPITRAQFAAICARFDDGKTQGGQTFTDIQGHWAQAYIERAAELGWIKGFEDGTFRPDTYITRAQAITMINRVLNRIPEDADDLLSNMNVWTDCNPGDWFYLAVQEATNSHDYKHKAGNYETWSSMNKDPDWTRYEN